MDCRGYSDERIRSCIRAVYVVWRGFRVLDQGVGLQGRRRRTHQGCIGCGENTRPSSSPRIQTWGRKQQTVQHIQITRIFLFGRNRIFSSRPYFLDGTGRKDESRLAASSAATRRA